MRTGYLAPARVDGRVRLYLDWCTARDRSPFPLTPQQVAGYARDTGHPPRTGWMRVVLAEQARRGHRLDLVGSAPTPSSTPHPVPPPGHPAWLVAAARCAANAGGALRWTQLITGRRDAVVLVARWLGRSRRGIVSLTTADLRGGGALGHLSSAPQTSDHPLSCPASVVGDWAAVLPALQSGSRAAAQDVVLGGNAHHAEPADGPLLFAVDRHGWADPQVPLSPRAVTAITAVRLAHAATPQQDGLPETDRDPADTAGAGVDVDGDLEALLDRLDDAADDLARRTAVLLAEAGDQAAWVRAAWL